jgi:hypothetical protein
MANPSLSRDYLARSGYAGLSSTDFAVGGVGKFSLTAVSDLTGGSKLAGSDDAFALSFSGPATADAAGGVRTFQNPELGSFDMFVVPDGPTGSQAYTAIVNRSVGATKRAIAAAPQPQTPSTSAPKETPKQARKKAHAEIVRAIALHRSRHGARCEVKVNPTANIESVSVWLMRGERLVASATHKVTGHHATLRLPSKRRLRRGGYTVAVVAYDASGDQHGRSKRVTLR